MTRRRRNEPTLYDLAQMNYEAREVVIDWIRARPVSWVRRCRRGWRQLTAVSWVRRCRTARRNFTAGMGSVLFAILYPAIYSAAYRQGHRHGYRCGRRVAKPVLAAHNQLAELHGYVAKHAKAGG